MNIDEKLALVKQVGEEIVTEEELKKLLESDMNLRHYIGFEISGQVHLGTGLMCMRAIKAFQEMGIDTSCFLANWHSFINRKLGGDMDIIREMARSYFQEALIASALCVGADPKKITFVLADDVYDNDYWLSVLEVASDMTLSRSKRSLDIAGRSEGNEVALSLMFYPPMQVADIFHQQIHIAHAGTDQRKAHIVARMVADKLRYQPLLNTKGEKIKPVAIHHHLLQGLGKPPMWPVPEGKRRDMLVSLKMSKSKPDSAVFVHDDPEVIKDKINKAFCPPKETELNPIIDWITHLILPLRNEFILTRPDKFGGTVKFNNMNELIQAYENESVHPQDLKANVSEYLIEILKPARDHFDHPERQKALKKMEEIQITR